MSEGMLIELAVSLAGIAILIAVSWLLGAMKSVAVTEEAAQDRLAFDEPDFDVGEWFFGADGKGAAAVSADGSETAVVFANGDGLGTRRFRHGSVGVERHGTIIEFRMREPSLRAVRVVATDETTAEQWVLSLAGARL
ncbi:MAG: hypothetical protein AB7F91_14315 [Parvularculaceae bacterium]|nr:hypothetical protein [Parvularculaceae bacterium]